jgi:hypothetical protein
VGSVQKSEQYVKNALQLEGWCVMHKGFPDFLCYKIIDNKLQIKFIEVKSGKDTLTIDQRKMQEIFKKVGLIVSTYIIDEKDIISINFTCSKCGRNIPNNTKYCVECNIETIRERARENSRNKRRKGSYDLYEEQYKKETTFRRTWVFNDDRCECSKKQQNVTYDDKHGDIICKDCGLIVGWLHEG